MDYFQRIQQAVDFIEQNLTEPIHLNEVAQQAHCSLYHFHRIFHGMIVEAPKEYIRKRRLTEAVIELIATKQRIIEIAFKYQYQTPESFSRAFRKMFGENPGKYRKRKLPHIIVRKIDVYQRKQFLLQGGLFMEPKIINLGRLKSFQPCPSNILRFVAKLAWKDQVGFYTPYFCKVC